MATTCCHNANFFRDVAYALPDHVAIFAPAARGLLWDGDTGVPSFWGLASFVCRSFPIIGQVQGFVHKGFEADGFGGHPRSRNAHGVRIYDDAGRRAVSVTHMHGLRDLRGKSDTPERAAQARRLLALSDALAAPEDVAIICGDFNVEPHSGTLTGLANAGFTELVTDGGHLGTRTTHYGKPGKFADYMAINRRDAVREFRVVRDPEVSDHCPLVLTV